MKVILKQTQQVKEVSFGYATNYLFPKGLAVLATAANLQALELEQAKLAAVAKSAIKKQTDKAALLDGKKFTIKTKAGEKGKLFGALSKKELAGIIKVYKNEIILEKPIKKVGKYEIELKFGPKRAKVTVEVKGNK